MLIYMLTLFQKYKFFEYFIYFTIVIKIILLCAHVLKIYDINTPIYFKKKYNFDIELMIAYLDSIFIISTCLILLYAMNPIYISKESIGNHTKILFFIFAWYVLYDHIHYSPNYFKTKKFVSLLF